MRRLRLHNLARVIVVEAQLETNSHRNVESEERLGDLRVDREGGHKERYAFQRGDSQRPD